MCTGVLIGWFPATPSLSPAFGLIFESAIGQPRETTSLCDPLGSPYDSAPPERNQINAQKFFYENYVILAHRSTKKVGNK
jgi:hypothetical protein